MSSSGPGSSAVVSVSNPSASAARATASASMRSDLPRSRLERRELAINRVGTRTTRSPRAIRNRSKEPDTCRQSSSAHTRSGPSSACPPQHVIEPARADRGGLLVKHLPGRGGDGGERVRALVHVRTEHDHQRCPLLLAIEVDDRRTRLAGGGATLLSSHPGHPRPATSDTTKESQTTSRSTASKRVSSPPVGTFSAAPDVTDARITTASLKAAAMLGT